MSETPSPNAGAAQSGSLTPEAQMVCLCERFDSDWRTGCRPCIEDYLRAAPLPEQPLLLRKLVRLDIYHRRRQGKSLGPEDYQARFPVLELSWLAGEILLEDKTATRPLGPSQPVANDTPGETHRVTSTHQLCCPHCHNPIPYAGAQKHQVVCQVCGSSFRVESFRQAATLDEIRILGRFQLLERVGQGSYGAVWRARDRDLDRIVALKIPHASVLSFPAYQERFQREARAAAQLRHPGIVRLYEVPTLEGMPVLVSDFIYGMPLRDVLAARQPAFHETARLVAEVAEALHYAHGMGLVHRDIKPANIMVEYPSSQIASNGNRLPNPVKDLPESALGRPIIVDFGLALREDAEIVMTVEGQIIGTPAYMSPEQALGSTRGVDRRSDVYSLGVVLYQMLCGELPFRGSKAMMVHQVLHEEPRPLRSINDKIPRDLETICLKAMAKQPARRYATALELAEDLRRFLRGEPIQARPVGRIERTWRLCRRNPLVAGLTAGIALSLIAGMAIAWFLFYQAVREADRANKARRESERRLYGARINGVQRDWQDAHITQVKQQLDDLRPKAGESDLRGFEWYYLQRLCRLDLRTWRGQTSKIHALALHPSGQRLAAAGDDQTVEIWDTARGKVIGTLAGHKSAVFTVAFCPQGKLLASGGEDGKVRIWSLTASKPVATLTGHTLPVRCVMFSPCGRRLASAAGADPRDLEGEVKIWDVESGREIASLAGHKRAVRAVTFSPEGRWLATASNDPTIRIWDLETLKTRQLKIRQLKTRQLKTRQLTQPVRRFKGHTFGVCCLAFNYNGSFVASGSSDGTVKTWNPATGQLLNTFRGHADHVLSLAFSRDGKRLISSGSDRVIKVWQTATGEEIMTLRGHEGPVSSVAFHPNGWQIVSAGEDGHIKFWDADRSPEALSLAGHSNGVHQAVFSPDTRSIASASEDGTVKVWDARTGLERLTLRGLSQPVLGLAFSPDGRQIASASRDGTLAFWDAEKGKRLHTFCGSGTSMACIAYSLDGRRLIAGDKQGRLSFWEVSRKSLLRRWQGHPAQVMSVGFSPDGLHIASASQARLVGGKLIPGEAKVWEAASGKEILILQGHRHTVFGVTFSPDGRWLVSASADHTIKVWDAATGQLVQTLSGHTQPVHGVAFSRDGRRLASASYDQTVKVWDTGTWQELLSLRGHTGPVLSVAFEPDGMRLVSASHDNTLRIWEAQPWTPALAQEREALALLAYLLGQSRSVTWVRTQIKTERTISPPVREISLRLAGAYDKAR